MLTKSVWETKLKILLNSTDRDTSFINARNVNNRNTLNYYIEISQITTLFKCNDLGFVLNEIHVCYT